MMNILVVGGGGREHALVRALSASKKVKKIWCAPGNAGIAQIANCIANIQATDIDALADFAKEASMDLTIVGPEVPLALGIADRFAAFNLPISSQWAIQQTWENLAINYLQLWKK